MTPFQLALVYDWGQNGNISQYTASRPHVSRVSLVWKTPVIVATTELLTQFFLHTTAIRCCEGVGVPSFTRYPTWGFEGGRFFP